MGCMSGPKEDIVVDALRASPEAYHARDVDMWERLAESQMSSLYLAAHGDAARVLKCTRAV